MNVVRTLFLVLSVTLTSPVRAEGCSGGPDGGADATGNQCNAAAEPAPVAATTTPASFVAARRIADVRPARIARGAAPAAKTPASAAGVDGGARPRDRIATPATTASEPTRTARIDAMPASTCSGGEGGGMDATGNQCGIESARPEVAVLAHHGRH